MLTKVLCQTVLTSYVSNISRLIKLKTEIKSIEFLLIMGYLNQDFKQPGPGE